MHLERRRKRSSFTGLALQYYLASVARRNQVVAMVVADTAGLLVAGSMRGPEAEELAAVTPLLMRESADGRTLAERHDLPMSIERVPVEGESIYVCAVGEAGRCDLSLDEARYGVSRILATE